MGMEQLLSRQEDMNNHYPDTALNLSLLKWKPAISTLWKTVSPETHSSILTPQKN